MFYVLCDTKHSCRLTTRLGPSDMWFTHIDSCLDVYRIVQGYQFYWHMQTGNQLLQNINIIVDYPDYTC